MNENAFPRQQVNKGIIGGVALLSALIPVYVCAYSALLINQEVPVFSRQALNVLLVAAVYTAPFLFTSVFCQFLCTRFSARNVVASKCFSILPAKTTKGPLTIIKENL